MNIFESDNRGMIIDVQEIMNSRNAHSRVAYVNLAQSTKTKLSVYGTWVPSDVADLFIANGWTELESRFYGAVDIEKDGVVLHISADGFQHEMKHSVSVSVNRGNAIFDYSNVEVKEREYVVTAIVRYSGSPDGLLRNVRAGKIYGEIKDVRVKENNW